MAILGARPEVLELCEQHSGVEVRVPEEPGFLTTVVSACSVRQSCPVSVSSYLACVLKRRNSFKGKKPIRPQSLRRGSVEALPPGPLGGGCHSGPPGSSWGSRTPRPPAGLRASRLVQHLLPWFQIPVSEKTKDSGEPDRLLARSPTW